MVAGTYFSAVGELPWQVWVASVPYGLLCTTVLMGKHLDKMPYDEPTGTRTLPVLLGEPRARTATRGLLVAFYVTTLVAVVLGALPWPADRGRGRSAAAAQGGRVAAPAAARRAAGRLPRLAAVVRRHHVRPRPQGRRAPGAGAARRRGDRRRSAARLTRVPGPSWLSVPLAVAAGLALAWAALVVALLVLRPRGASLTEAVRLLPDVLRLLPRLARDGSLPRGVRVRLWLLLAYLASPIDLVPDVVPVLGYADDAVAVVVVLRAVARRAGPDALTRHWPGSDDGLAVLLRLTGLDEARERPA